jgi:endonuclease/exonuclease/phosphatase family metal-dependent hydrolase
LEWLNRSNDTGIVKRQDVDYDRLRKYAKQLDADIVAVQEVDGEEALRRVFDDAEYDYHVASQNGGQLTGFAYRATLSVTKNPDVESLDVGSVRTGTDLTVNVNGQPVRLLSVHLKSGCFEDPLTTNTVACTKLHAQLPKLEEWIDARAAASEPFLVLGGFNRCLKTGEAFYTEIDDGDPANADLTLVTDGRTSACSGGEFPQFIDHVVFSKNAASWMVPASFEQLTYDPADTAFKSKLTDHCPISVQLQPVGSGAGGGTTDPVDPDPGTSPAIKGNISSNGKKLYHLPSCPSYAQTQIDTSKGERFFATEAEAIAAGWQKAGNCP